MRGPLGPDVPRRLRGGSAEPGRADPLRGAQRAAERARRAHLRVLAGPRSTDARDHVPQFTVESHRPVGAFDLLGVSFSTELGYTNLLTALDLAGIPIDSDQRTDQTTHLSSQAVTPRSTRSRSPTSSTPPCSVTASRPCWRSRRSCASGRPRVSLAVATVSCCASRQVARCTCLASMTSTTCQTVASSGWCQVTPACRGALPSTR